MDLESSGPGNVDGGSSEVSVVRGNPEVWSNGDHKHADDGVIREKERMPDLIRVESLGGSSGLLPHSDGGGPRTPSPQQNGLSGDVVGDHQEHKNTPPSSQAQEAVASGVDGKKKISVESLSKEELIQQVKKQMLLLQKMKTRYDELQKKHTDMEQTQVSTGTAINGETESLQRRLAALESDLRQERDLHKRTKDQAAKNSQNSVADLEIRDYQRTISLLNEKLTVKDNCILRLNEQLTSSEQQITTTNSLLQEQTIRIDDLTNKCSRLEDHLTESHKECFEKEKIISAIREDNSSLHEKVRSLEANLGDHSHQQSDLVRGFSKLQEAIESKDRIIQQKTADVSRLTLDLSHARTQQEHLVREFDEYKLRAQTLLKQQKDSVNNIQRQKEIETLTARVVDLDLEVADLHHKNLLLTEECQRDKRVSETVKRSFETERGRWEKTILECEERIRSLETAQETNYQEQRRKIKVYESEISSLKDLHGSTNQKLLEELRVLRNQNDDLQLEKHQRKSEEKSPELGDMNGGENCDDFRFLRSKSEELSERLSDGASSSEDTPSVFKRTVSVAASDVISVQPLEKLIASQNHDLITAAKDADFRRIKHLSELLHESESTNVRLNEQIRLLKQEFRRLEANVEREKHANSMEYLKNVLMKFLTHRVAASEQEKLIEVMTTILKLTTEERQELVKAASASYIPENIKSWGTYLNPWKSKEG